MSSSPSSNRLGPIGLALTSSLSSPAKTTASSAAFTATGNTTPFSPSSSKLDFLTNSLSYLSPLKIAPFLWIIYLMFLKNAVIAISAGTGSGKTVATPMFLFEQTDPTLEGKRIFVAIPMVISVREQYKIAIKNNPHKAHDIAQICGGTRTPNANTARLTYATTQSVVNYLKKLNKKIKKATNKAELATLTAELNNLVIVIDEAHHPTKENYLLQGIVNNFLDDGYKLRVIMMTATPCNYPFPQLCIPPEQTFVLPDKANPIEMHYSTVSSVVVNEETGDTRIIGNLEDTVIAKVADAVKVIGEKDHILVFVPGESMAVKLSQKLAKRYPDCNVYSLYGSLPKEKTDEIFNNNDNKRKIIVSTNVAENGLTIPGVMAVIDTMLCTKVKFTLNGSLIEVCAISQASATQREGRAARTPIPSIGHCFVLMTREDYDKLSKNTDNEFFTTPPELTVLDLLSNGFTPDKVLKIEKTSYDKIIAYLVANQLIAIHNDNEYVPTNLGKEVSTYPLPIKLSCAIVRAKQTFNVSQTDFNTRRSNFIKLLHALIGSVVMACLSSGLDLFFVPEEERKNRKDFLTGQFFVNNFARDSDISIAIGAFCQMMRHQRDYKKWCEEMYINSKFMDSAYTLFTQVWNNVFKSVEKRSANTPDSPENFCLVMTHIDINKDSFYRILVDTYGDERKFSLINNLESKYTNVVSSGSFSYDNKSVAKMWDEKDDPPIVYALRDISFKFKDKNGNTRESKLLQFCFPAPQPELDPQPELAHQPDLAPQTAPQTALLTAPQTAPLMPPPLPPRTPHAAQHNPLPFPTGLEHIGLHQKVFVKFERNGAITGNYDGRAIDLIKAKAREMPPILLARSFVIGCLVNVRNENQAFHLHNLLRYLDNQKLIPIALIKQVIQTEGEALISMASATNSGASETIRRLKMI